MNKRLAQAWADYRKDNLPADLPAEDVAMVRQAFFAGALGVWVFVVSARHLTRAEFAEQGDALNAELEEFAEEIVGDGD